MKRLIFFLILSTSMLCSTAQSSFKRLPKPASHGFGLPAGPTKMTAFRFTSPFAGYMMPQNQIVTGAGFGWNKLHYVDSTSRWYSDLSINGVIYAGGNVSPSIEKNNVISAGLSIGFLNQLIMLGGAYNFPTETKGGTFGLVINLAVPLN